MPHAKNVAVVADILQYNYGQLRPINVSYKLDANNNSSLNIVFTKHLYNLVLYDLYKVLII